MVWFDNVTEASAKRLDFSLDFSLCKNLVKKSSRFSTLYRAVQYTFSMYSVFDLDQKH